MYLSDSQIDSGALARRLLAPANNLVPVNLLTRQQASLEDAGTAGWAAFSAAATITRDTTYAANGTASLLLTATGTASCQAHLSSGIPVSGSRVYTALASIRSGVGSRSVRIGVTWYDAAGTKINDSETGNLTPTATFTEARMTVVSPSNAATARVTLTLISSGSANDTSYFDKIGLWEGAGGSWVNGGERLDPSTLGGYWNAAGTGYYQWNTVTNAYVLIYGS